MLGRKDPYFAYNFVVEFGGIISGGFTEVSGLSIQTDVEKVKEGGVNDFEYKLPKGTTYTDITLKKGITDEALWSWYMGTLHGKIIRIPLSICLLDHSRNEIMRWNIFEAYPIKWEGPTFNASSNTVATESIVLAHHGMVPGGLKKLAGSVKKIVEDFF